MPYIQDGETALYIAVSGGHRSVVEILLQTQHTDVNISQKVYMTTSCIAWVYTRSYMNHLPTNTALDHLMGIDIISR